MNFTVVRKVPGPVADDRPAPCVLPAAGHPHRALLTLLLSQEVPGVREGCCPWINIGEGEHLSNDEINIAEPESPISQVFNFNKSRL